MEADATKLQEGVRNDSKGSLQAWATRQTASGGFLAQCHEADCKSHSHFAKACRNCDCFQQTDQQAPVLVEQVEWSTECQQGSTFTVQLQDGEQDLPEDGAPDEMPNCSAPNLIIQGGRGPAVDTVMPSGIEPQVSSAQSSRDEEGSTTQTVDFLPPSEGSGYSELGPPRLPAPTVVLTAFSDRPPDDNKANRCTPKTPFWSVTNAQILRARQGDSISHGGLDSDHASRSCECVRRPSCLTQHEADGIDTSIDYGEILEENITSIDLNSEEQRIDWRDFFCEVVASRRAVSLYQLYDVEADPPRYARPPPSVPQPDSIGRAYAQMGRLPLPCIAPNGTGWSHVGGSAHTALGNGPPQEVSKDLARDVTRELTELTKEMTDRSFKSGQRSPTCSAYEY